jgi:Uma2 family endonuclease
MSATPRSRSATFEDLARLGDARVEIIHGVIVDKALPTMEHADSQVMLSGFVSRRFRRGGGGRWPGGWWIATEIDVEYEAHQIFRHDVAGWRRDRVPERPRGRPVRFRPNWVAEIVSPSNERRDLVDKFDVLRRSEVPYYWLLKPEEKVLVVHRLDPPDYVVALTATSGQTVRAEPFDAVELGVGILFGDEEDEE